MAEPGPQEDFKHRILEEDVCIIWPLSPQLHSLWEIPVTAKEVTIQGEQASVLRLTLNNLLMQDDSLYQYAQRAVFRISPDTVVKIDKSHDTTEVHILDHIHKHSQGLPVPTPLGMITIGK
jgi:hypothetical protein